MKILFVGPLPPPVHGQSLATARFAALLEQYGLKVYRRDISGGIAQKLIRHLEAVQDTLRGRGPCYFSVNSNKGIWLTTLVVLLARMRARPIYLHHHSFGNVNEYNFGMAALVKSAGASSVHIVLAEIMASLLASRYAPKRLMVLNNAGFVHDYGRLKRTPSDKLRLGFIGNLTPEKGVESAISVALELKRRHIPCSLSIAGPIASHSVSESIRVATLEFGTDFRHYGPVNEAQKADFYEAVDILLFPSRYRNEAVPLVVLEALSASIPVVSTDVGCLPEILTMECGHVLDCDFNGAQSAILDMATALPEYSRAARRRYELLRAEFQAQSSAIVACLNSSQPPATNDQAPRNTSTKSRA